MIEPLTIEECEIHKIHFSEESGFIFLEWDAGADTEICLTKKDLLKIKDFCTKACEVLK
jgi:hypothetical protein